MPGIYAVTSIPLVRRIRANFLKAEFGFFGVIVPTLIATPLLNGDAYCVGLFFLALKPRAIAGDLVFALVFFLGFFSNCLYVGICLNKLKHKNKTPKVLKSIPELVIKCQLLVLKANTGQ